MGQLHTNRRTYANSEGEHKHGGMATSAHLNDRTANQPLQSAAEQHHFLRMKVLAYMIAPANQPMQPVQISSNAAAKHLCCKRLHACPTLLPNRTT